MFITNPMPPEELLSQLFGAQAPATDTAEFRSLKHNYDLCPRFQEKIDTMLLAYSRHRADVRDLQSMRDDGVDVLIRYVNEDDHVRVGLQIKSYSEFEEWRKGRRPSLVATLKTQYTDAIKKARVGFMYFVLCTDAAAHRDLIRLVNSEFKIYDDVKIIEPKNALGFLRTSDWEIQAQAVRLLCEGDYVRNRASKILRRYSGFEKFVAVELVVRALEGERIISDDHLMGMESDWLQSFEENQGKRHVVHADIGDAVATLEGIGLISRVDGGDDFVIYPESMLAICALYFDQRVRNGIRGDKACLYLRALLEDERDTD